MKLLDMPPIRMNLSMQYANLDSEKVWSEKIRVAQNFYTSSEIDTVKHGVRDAMLLHNVYPEQVVSLSRHLSKFGLGVFPATKGMAQSANTFNHQRIGYVKGNDFRFTAIVCRSTSIAEEYFHATYASDDHKIGRILGFPECCCSFFNEHWKNGYTDPIWQQAFNAGTKSLKAKRALSDKNLIRLRAAGENWKIISSFRYIGIRCISHFACSPDCEKSIEIANKWIQLGNDLKTEGLNETLEILQLPFEWNCLKGCLVVSSPVFKFFAPSVPCYPAHVIQQEGNIFPEEAPNGLSFPWNEFYRGNRK